LNDLVALIWDSERFCNGFNILVLNPWQREALSHKPVANLPQPQRERFNPTRDDHPDHVSPGPESAARPRLGWVGSLRIIGIAILPLDNGTVYR